MKAFEEGQRVRYMGMRGPGTEWHGREGVVTEVYRDYDGYRAKVLLEGVPKAWSFGVEDLEPVKTPYTIENWGEESTSVTLELTDPEAALITRVIDALNETNVAYTPQLTITKKEK